MSQRPGDVEDDLDLRIEDDDWRRQRDAWTPEERDAYDEALKKLLKSIEAEKKSKGDETTR